MHVMIMIIIIDSELECTIYKILIITHFRVLVSEHEQTCGARHCQRVPGSSSCTLVGLGEECVTRLKAKRKVEAIAEVRGLHSTCNLTFFWAGWQKIVAQIRGVFLK